MNFFLLMRLPVVSGFFSWDVLLGIIPIGATMGYSGVVLAHELVHRREKRFNWMARMILFTVLYDHFYVEHIRGHHLRVGTFQDPATARFNENYIHYFFRNTLGQFTSAWDLESKRIKRKKKAFLNHLTFQGVVIETGLILSIFLYFGTSSILLLILNSLVVHTVTHAVSYIEHYGLTRNGKAVTYYDSWDSQSAFSLYSLIGLTMHSDHHIHPHKPYQILLSRPESPKLPFGYFVCTLLVIFRNQLFRKLAKEELKRQKLGPFAQA